MCLNTAFSFCCLTMCLNTAGLVDVTQCRKISVKARLVSCIYMYIFQAIPTHQDARMRSAPTRCDPQYHVIRRLLDFFKNTNKQLACNADSGLPVALSVPSSLWPPGCSRGLKLSQKCTTSKKTTLVVRTISLRVLFSHS
jgi:hypothetical protein